MKKFFIITVAAAAAALLLCSASENATTGRVEFQSDKMPALNCSLPMSAASQIFRLLPDSVSDLCREEYSSVRGKCGHSQRFVHEGVRVKVIRSGEDTATIEFSVQDYRVTARDVRWSELDLLFSGQ